jgi:peptidoglycan/xylan/chitin deacetylase (PgdA/CDA1 family)
MRLRKAVKSLAYLLRGLLTRKKGCLILAYHSVDKHNDQYTVEPKVFQWQMSEIARQGLRVITLAELEKMINAGHVEDGTVVLTFDDGREDNYTNTFPILKQHKFPATIFSITGIIGGEYVGKARAVPILSEAQMREMHASMLIDFEPHTVTHPKLPNISTSSAAEEITTSKEVLEAMLAKECPYFAYPYGRFTQEVKETLKSAGIRLAVATHAGFVTAVSDRLALPRNDIRRDVTNMEFKSILRRGSLR